MRECEGGRILMIRLTQSLQQWLWDNHPELIGNIMFGHVELFTEDMQREYLAWCETDDGKQAEGICVRGMRGRVVCGAA